MKYSLCSKRIFGESGSETVYGVILPDGERIDDITFDKKAAEGLVRQLNDNNVSSVHAIDVIEDFLFQSTTVEIKYYE